MIERYGTIIADPPWQYRNAKTGGSLSSGASQKYATLSTAEIGALPVHEIAAENAILFLWATSPMLPDALAVMDAWGFTYKGSLVWVKTSADSTPIRGLGYHFRNGVEYLLFGIRGRVPALRCQLSNVVLAPVRGHSAKPDYMWQRIEGALAGREDLEPRLELFCRGTPRVGWHGWGIEAENGVSLPALEATV